MWVRILAVKAYFQLKLMLPENVRTRGCKITSSILSEQPREIDHCGHCARQKHLPANDHIATITTKPTSAKNTLSHYCLVVPYKFLPLRSTCPAEKCRGSCRRLIIAESYRVHMSRPTGFWRLRPRELISRRFDPCHVFSSCIPQQFWTC